MEPALKALNVAQRAAVLSPATVLQVLAPPGSGKTKTLTSRVAYLLAHHGYKPWNVICCTFTIKASREMRERLRGMVGQDIESRLILGTFHSICRRYLVRYGHLIGLPKNFGIADSDDSLKIVKRHVKRLNLRDMEARAVRSRISHKKAKGELLFDKPAPVPKTPKDQDFATLFQAYEEDLAASNMLDYDDLLLRCVDLLRQHRSCVSNVEALLIDEFQDTNIVQFELMKLLASARRHVTIVGDPDQSIYGFRSAEIENLHRMRIHYPETVVINLEENYRSSTAVLRLAQEVIEQDGERPDKKLRSTHRYGTLPVLRRLPNKYEEAHWIVSEIKRMEAMTGSLIQHNDIAILIRSAYLSLQIEKALAGAGIPYRIVGGRRFFDRPEIRILLDYLRTISHPENDSALMNIVNNPKRKIGDITLNKLVALAKKQNESVWATIEKVLSGSLSLDKKLSAGASTGLRGFQSLIRTAQKSMEGMKPIEAPGKLLSQVMRSLNYKEFLEQDYPDDHAERWENACELLNQASDPELQFNVSDEDLPEIDGVAQAKTNGAQEVLSRFRSNVALSTEVEAEEGQQTPKVTISTIHSAKGLEWPVVFVPAVYEGSIPHSRAEQTDEERRLLYVAITRAQALLYMTFPIMQDRDESESVLSQFLPTTINSFLSQIGPVFSDQVVEEVAAILKRPVPTQEALAAGRQGLKDTESPEDDILPADGSHKRGEESPRRPYTSFTPSMGRPLSETMRDMGPTTQKTNYSTTSYSNRTTMANSASFSTANLTVGFTTAGHHHRTYPQPPHRSPTKPTLVKSSTVPSTFSIKKPKLAKSMSGQGTLSSFFSRSASTVKTESASSISNRLQAQISSHWTEKEIQNVTELVKSEPSIPIELSKHKLSTAGSTFGRPLRIHNTDLDHNVSIGFGIGGKRDHDYAFDIADINKGEKVIDTKTALDVIDLTESEETENNNRTRTESQSQSQNQNPARRTLGVRRSMNGWTARKHK